MSTFFYLKNGLLRFTNLNTQIYICIDACIYRSENKLFFMQGLSFSIWYNGELSVYGCVGNWTCFWIFGGKILAPQYNCMILKS